MDGQLLTDTISAIEGRDTAFQEKAAARLCRLTMPRWALGRVLNLAVDMCGMTQSLTPPVERKAVVVFAGDHGVCEEGVSLYPQTVTTQMVYNFVKGGAAVNALARGARARVTVVDMGVAADLSNLKEGEKIISKKIRSGTMNIAKGPAMSRTEAVRSIEAGIEVALMLGDSTDVFGVGEMGIGNTTPSAAVVSTLAKLPPAEVTGLGTGIDEEMHRRKIGVVEQSLIRNRPDASDGLDVLAKMGGFEIGGMAGLYLGAARLRRPVVVDGFISTAAALIAATICPSSRDYMIAAHQSVEKGHIAALKHLRLEPLLDLHLRLGEGTGAVLAMNLIDAARLVLTDVATFEEASVSEAMRQ